MKPIIIEMKDLSESTEIYEKKPNPAIVGFIYILLGVIVVSVLWMAMSEIDIVTEAEGILLYSEDVSAVTCDYNARIVKCNVTDGQYITEGTVLYELKFLMDDAEEKEKAKDLMDGQPVIRARESGYFYASAEGEVGTALAAESCVGYIFPQPQKTFYAMIIVEAADIGKIKEGQEVKLEVDAYPASEYGTVTGHIRKISKEAQWSQEDGTPYFQVWVTLDANALVNKDNEEVPLMNGLRCQARIVTGRKRVLPYLWENAR